MTAALADNLLTSDMVAPGAEKGWQAPVLAVIVPTFNERANVPVLYERVSAILANTPFEFIVVDDNSPDGTAGLVHKMSLQHPNVRCIRRVGRRGLSSAVVEGMLLSGAPYLAVIDADLQHDEAILPYMLAQAVKGADVVVGTRYAGTGSAGDGLSTLRERGSRLATRLATLLTHVQLSDPMSGFFLIRREVLDDFVADVSKEGFKILLDILVSASRSRERRGEVLSVAEMPYTFRPRVAGESKMSSTVVVQYLGLLLSKATKGLLPTSFLLFGMVGATGIFVHLCVLWLTSQTLGMNFSTAQLTATMVAMTTNFILNNELTYADRKLRGYRFWVGLVTFYLSCSIGTLANVSVATWVYDAGPPLLLAGIAGALMSMVFNYSVTKLFTWR